MPELTEAQHEARRTRIGASEVGALLGHHPWTDPARIFARIMDGPDPKKQTESMRAGHLLERAIGHAAASDLGLSVRACSRTYVHPTLPLAASPDFYCRDAAGIGGVLEVKLSRDWSDWLDGPPPWYAWQVRAQLALTDRPYGILAALVGTSLQVHAIERDAGKEAELFEAVAAFDRDYLAPSKPPPTDDVGLMLRWQLGDGQTIASGDLATLGDYYAGAVRIRKGADLNEAERREAFARALADRHGTRMVLGTGWSARIDDRGTLRFDVRGKA
jgi:predicted phage-related endonuclease